MSTTPTPPGPELTTNLPMTRINELCRKYGVSELAVCGSISDGVESGDEGILFLVLFLGDDFGPWGSKLDLLENDLSGTLHRKVHVSSRRGIHQSTASPRKEEILDSARLIYGA